MNDTVADLLARGDPRVWRALLGTHVADGSGRCPICAPSSGPAPVWPCRLCVVADAVRRAVRA